MENKDKFQGIAINLLKAIERESVLLENSTKELLVQELTSVLFKWHELQTLMNNTIDEATISEYDTKCNLLKRGFIEFVNRNGAEGCLNSNF